MDVASLADLLHETAQRHDWYEQVAPPHDWWDWYAAYMDARDQGGTPDEASEVANRYMAEVKRIGPPNHMTSSAALRDHRAEWHNADTVVVSDPVIP
jgi:hypothetical protein